MTLSTYVYIKDPVDYREVFTKCNQLIGAHEGVKFREDDDSIHNSPDQGLCAWLLLYHGHGKPYCTPGRAAQHDEDCGDCEGPCEQWHPRACWLKVNFDTAYSYSDKFGGCGDLHARIIAQLGQWLDEKGAGWEWTNEFTGETHSGYDRLPELGSGGADAQRWFVSQALPAIAAHIASGQS